MHVNFSLEKMIGYKIVLILLKNRKMLYIHIYIYLTSWKLFMIFETYSSKMCVFNATIVENLLKLHKYTTQSTFSIIIVICSFDLF